MARGIFLVYTNCKDAARHEEFNRWYSHAHVEDLKAVRGLMSARRFVNPTPEEGPSQYLAIYVLDSDDLDASRADLERLVGESGERGRNIDCLELAAACLYREIDPSRYKPLERVDYPPRPLRPPRPGPPEVKLLAATLPRGISYVLTNCTDPGRDEEFNRWYSHTHLPDLSVRPGQVKATRYRNEHPERGPAMYMALYEWLGEDIRKTTAEAMRAVHHVFENRHIDCLKSVASGNNVNIVFQEIDGGAYEPVGRSARPPGPGG